MEEQVQGGTTLSERFEAAFNKIHLQLRMLANKDAGFAELLHLSRHRYLIRRYYEDLKQFARLRNAIVHEKISPQYYIAEPHLEIVNQIESICEQISQPASAMDIATTDVICFKPSDPLQKVMRAVERTGYSQYPIYDGYHFEGLLTTDGMVTWLARNKCDPSTPIANILPSVNTYHSAFVSKQATVFDLEEVFEQNLLDGVKLEAVIITPKGTMEELPVGLITAWDLIKIETTNG